MRRSSLLLVFTINRHYFLGRFEFVHVSQNWYVPVLGTSTKIFAGIRPVTMETRCFLKRLEFQRYPPKDLCTARYDRKSSEKKTTNLSKTPKK